jgi:hypothetical protein
MIQPTVVLAIQVSGDFGWTDPTTCGARDPAIPQITGGLIGVPKVTRDGRIPYTLVGGSDHPNSHGGWVCPALILAQSHHPWCAPALIQVLDQIGCQISDCSLQDRLHVLIMKMEWWEQPMGASPFPSPLTRSHQTKITVVRPYFPFDHPVVPTKASMQLQDACTSNLSILDNISNSNR